MGDAHVAKESSSSAHSNVASARFAEKVNNALVLAVSPSGPDSIAVSTPQTVLRHCPGSTLPRAALPPPSMLPSPA
jgi:hypothetical protein